jgi:hypothetical protein
MGYSLSLRAAVGLMLTWAWLVAPPPALGHDEGVRAEVLPPSVVAGSTVEVTAAELAPNLPVQVQLVTGSGPIDIGSGTTGHAGQLELRATLPVSAMPRYYEIHVAAVSGVVAVGYVEVLGRAAAEGRDEVVTWPWLAALVVLAVGIAALVGRRSRPQRSRR